ncbi:MAG TPA: hypothetical protein PK957_01305 [Candidatus Dojkabacteria bacterium]|nr:hypothetical protein [Candidatus Dojkabacteria bacterium]HQF36300.1 hypothetical protein [Candidatus Dojkabacteria bacterium]
MITSLNKNQIKIIKYLIPFLVIVLLVSFFAYQKSNSINAIFNKTAKLRTVNFSIENVKFKQIDQTQLQNLFYTQNDEPTEKDLLYQAFKYFDTDETISNSLSDDFNEEILGYYSVSEKIFYTSVNKSDISTLNPVERYIFSHEFTHYLQDSTFDISNIENSFDLQSEQNSDKRIAFIALLEGDATFTALMYTNHNDIEKVEQSVISANTNKDNNSMHPYVWNVSKLHYIEAPLFILDKYKQNNNYDNINKLYQTLEISTGEIINTPNNYDPRLNTEFSDSELKDVEIKKTLFNYQSIYKNYTFGPWEIRTIFSKFLEEDDVEKILKIVEGSTLALWYNEKKDSSFIYWKIDYKDNEENITYPFEKYCNVSNQRCDFEISDQYLNISIERKDY